MSKRPAAGDGEVGINTDEDPKVAGSIGGEEIVSKVVECGEEGVEFL
jgi:hypothetical protein